MIPFSITILAPKIALPRIVCAALIGLTSTNLIVTHLPKTTMSAETYLNHPTFGLLHRICQLDNKRELFTTLYAQRMFFLVEQEGGNLKIESLGRSNARLSIEQQIRTARSQGDREAAMNLQKVLQKVFG
jgi:PII interaction protein X